MDPQASPPFPPSLPGTVLDRLRVLGEEVAALGDAELWRLSDAESVEAVRRSFVLLQQYEFVRLGLVLDLDQRPGVVVTVRTGTTARSFLRGVALSRTSRPASADVQAVQVLGARPLVGAGPDPDPDLDTGVGVGVGGLPVLAAFAAGLVSREHVDVAVRTVRKVPAGALVAPMPDLGPELGSGLSVGEEQAFEAVTGRSVVMGVGLCGGEGVDRFLTRNQADLDETGPDEAAGDSGAQSGS